MRVSLFDFELPETRIAQSPSEPRDAARLLHVTNGELDDTRIAALPSLLDENDLLVFNDTRVIPARLNGHRGEVPIELLLHLPLAEGQWKAFARPAKRLRCGDIVRFGDVFAATVIDKLDSGEVVVRFDEDAALFRQHLERHGDIPLPPYIRRDGKATDADRERYQTLHARHDGAIAAPTAGLHFTPALMDAIAARGARTEYVTLHVGAGTFLPVKAEDTSEHRMHSERGTIDPQTADRIAAHKRRGGRVVAVGTTSLRLLEAAAATSGQVEPYHGETDIFITPGYRFRVVDRLLTNFHLPRSTLFMLVSAFCGIDRMQAAYRHAIAREYRFYSYGDACLLEKQEAVAA